MRSAEWHWMRGANLVRSAPPQCVATVSHQSIHHFGAQTMTTHFKWATTRLPNTIRLLFGLAVILLIPSAAFAQPPTGTVKKLVLKSAVLGEERTILVRTPVGYETNKVS